MRNARNFYIFHNAQLTVLNECGAWYKSALSVTRVSALLCSMIGEPKTLHRVPITYPPISRLNLDFVQLGKADLP